MAPMIADAVRIAGGQTELARRIGAKPQEIWNWCNGRQIPAERCPSIERAVAGQVGVEALRPDVHWHRVPDPCWPHPGGRPLIDVAGCVSCHAD